MYPILPPGSIRVLFLPTLLNASYCRSDPSLSLMLLVCLCGYVWLCLCGCVLLLLHSGWLIDYCYTTTCTTTTTTRFDGRHRCLRRHPPTTTPLSSGTRSSTTTNTATETLTTILGGDCTPRPTPMATKMMNDNDIIYRL